MMKYLIQFSRIFTGIVFVFSGFVKTVDPLGSAYKFSDYFNAFGLGFLEPLALPMAVLLSSVEATMGIALLLSYRMKFFSWLVMFFMVSFTILTFFLAVYNPVSDCGCFGDAIILTNWETFWKNVIILIFVVLMFWKRINYSSVTGVRTEWMVVILVSLVFSAVSIYSWYHLPLLDFRPYNTGSNIPAKMTVPQDAPADVYETRLIYKNKHNGKEEIFSLEDFPSDTNTYSFVDAQSILISKGYETPIHDFFITTQGGNDITDIILHDPGFSFLLISHDLSKASRRGLIQADEYAKFAKLTEDVRFYCITASSDEIINDISNELDLSYDFYHADEITLKTVIRSNPGLVLLKNGTILGKWHFNDFPVFGSQGSGISELTASYPFSPGVQLDNLRLPPPGADSDVYETILYYRNISTDSIVPFRIDNFPNSPDWLFVNSESRIIREGYKSPLNAFQPVTPEGINVYSDITGRKGNVFIILVGDPGTVKDELLTRVNHLSVVAASIDTADFSFYGVTGLSRDDLLSFTEKFVSPVLFTTVDPEFIRPFTNQGITLLWIRDGRVMNVVKNENIPLPSEFEEFLNKQPKEINAEQLFIPFTISNYRALLEKRLVYLFIVGFIAFVLLLRAYFEHRRPGS